MKKTFDETRFGQILSGVIEIIWSGILFILCSVPVITLGAAYCALYYSVTKSVRHERGHLTREFFRGFGMNFRNATPVWITYLIVIIPTFFIKKLVLFYIIPVALTIPWIFPYISRFSESFGSYWKHTLYLVGSNIPKTLAAVLLLAVSVLIGYLVPAIIPLLPGVVCLTLSYLTEPVFRKITANSTEDENDDKWYNE